MYSMDQNNLIKTLFIEGATLIFKKWSSFRMALDNTPEVLKNYTDENNTQLEINEMLNVLFGDIMIEIEKESGSVLETNIADLIFCFFQEFFDVDLEDDSERFVAKNLIKLYGELKSNKLEYLERLRQVDKTFNYSTYYIKFPIVIEETKLIKDFENQMAIDEVENTQNNKVNNNKKEEMDDEGFVIVKKKKKY
jgi:hypothetical protein